MNQLPTADIGRPIRVVVFPGQFPEPAAERFLAGLTQHAEIELVGGFREARSESLAASVGDLWRRRGALALPLLAARLVGTGVRFVRSPSESFAVRRGLLTAEQRIQRVRDIHAPEVLEAVRALEPDLGLIYGGPILLPRLFEIPRFGTLGIHHGSLPAYRGKKTTFWEVYEGEPAAGVTIQRVNAGVDTGDVVQAEVVPTAGKTYARVTREVQALGVSLYLAAVLEVKRGQATLRPATGPKGRLRRDPTLGQLLELRLRQLRFGLGSLARLTAHEPRRRK
jgi:folate-dependent phosphoribosylglycinamide formyltransferase PurN